jgi:hypothetical protein
MIQADKDRVGVVMSELAIVESPLKYWDRDIKGIIAEMEKRAKDKATGKEERAANLTKRIPAAKTLLKSVEIALPAVKAAIDIKYDKYATAEDYLKDVGARAAVLVDEVVTKMNQFHQTMDLGSGMTYLSVFGYMKEMATGFKSLKAGQVNVKQKLASLRGAPARPAAAAPQRLAAAAPAVRP